MKKKKSKLSGTDIARLPRTEVKNESGFQTRQEFYEQEERERQEVERRQKEMQERPLRAAEDELKQAAREQTERVKKFYSLPLQAMAEFGLDFAVNDLAGDYPLHQGPVDSKSDAAAYRRFKENLASHGCTLSTEGWSRLGSYLAAVRFHRGISLSSVDSWAIGLERLVTLDILQPGEITGYVKPTHDVKQPNVAVDPTFDELASKLSTESYEGRKALIAAAESEAQLELHPVWSAFESSLRTNFDGFVLTPTQRRKFYDTMIRQQMRLNYPPDYDRVRVALAKAGEIPSHLLYPAEKLEIDFESKSLDDYQNRRDFIRRAMECNRTA
jgi:hypothetical protein